MMGHNVIILAGLHKYVFENPLTYKPNVENGYDIKISVGASLTIGVVVTGGLNIGGSTTVLPLSVVDASLLRSYIAAGNPARSYSNKIFEE
jgi:acetyltransferase-like isoleucine patch superfamily enzyme